MHLMSLNTIIVSPQPWNHIAISKHHYAIELARRGNQVLFVNPPNEQLHQHFRVSDTTTPNVRCLEYRRPWFYRLRFHWRGLYDLLMAQYIGGILRRVGFRADLCWCFEFNLFSRLDAFGARSNIFNPVDPLSAVNQTNLARHADLVLTVSQQIANSMMQVRPDVHVLGHGLSEDFAKYARARLAAPAEAQVENRKIRVGYTGNLMRKPLNRSVLKQLIVSQAEVEFHFWGPFDTAPAENAAVEFIRFVQSPPHVHLHGKL